MVVFCKRCGSPVKLDNARLADAGYSMKCQQCQRPVELDTVRPRARSAAPGPGAPRLPRHNCGENAGSRALRKSARRRSTETTICRRSACSAAFPTKNVC